jgi:hypothetical protein
MDLPFNFKAYPFKLNAQWLKDQDFVDLVHKVWKDPGFLSECNKQHMIVWKLKVLKSQTKSWYKTKLAKNTSKLLSLEYAIKETIIDLVVNPSNLENELSLRQMEGVRNNILKEVEDQWRLHSRAIWLASGDNNTKFFHKYATFNRTRKHIW